MKLNPKWLDISSYSRTDTDRTPRSWLLDLKSVGRLVVTRHKDYAFDEWVIVFPDGGKRVADSKNIDKARIEAQLRMATRLEAVLDVLNEEP